MPVKLVVLRASCIIIKKVFFVMGIFKGNNISRCPFCGRRMKRFMPIITISDEEEFKSKVLSRIEHITNKESQKAILENIERVIKG